jgi:hypothetical protein
MRTYPSNPAPTRNGVADPLLTAAYPTAYVLAMVAQHVPQSSMFYKPWNYAAWRRGQLAKAGALTSGQVGAQRANQQVAPKALEKCYASGDQQAHAVALLALVPNAGPAAVQVPAVTGNTADGLRDSGGSEPMPPYEDTSPAPEAAPEADEVTGGIHLSLEGRRRLALHIRTERSASNRARVLECARRERGTLACEACDLAFAQAFGVDFEGLIEVHHRMLVSNGERTPSLEDYALVCPNCHRMAHWGMAEPRPVEVVRQLVKVVRTNKSPHR